MIIHYKSFISKEDINTMKNIYRLGIEGGGRNDISKENKIMKPHEYNTNLVNSETFFCDLGNTTLLKILYKYFKLDSTEYITNVHYIKYKEGECAKLHADKTYKTFVILLNENFEGGEFIGEGKVYDLKVGDLLSMNALDLHEVTTVKKGFREVLVSFIEKYKKESKSLI